MSVGGLFRLILLAVLGVAAVHSVTATAHAEDDGTQLGLVRRLVDSGCLAPSSGEPSSGDIAAAIQGCPSVDPVFRVENGFNNAKMNRIATDRDCRVIATASEDKTARVFDGDGHLMSTLRVPIGPGNGGKLRAVAVSPDGRMVVVGGWDVLTPGGPAGEVANAPRDNSAYVFDAQTGALLRRIGGFPYDIKHIVFSPDGSRLAVVMGGNVFVLETKGWSQVFRDDTWKDMIYGAAFGPDNTFFAGSTEGEVRKYTRDGRPGGRIVVHQMNRMFGLAVDPSGRMVVVASIDAPGSLMIDAQTMKVVGSLDYTGMESYPLTQVAVNANASFAAGGGYLLRTTGKGTIRVWKAGNPPSYFDIETRDDSVSAIAGCGSGFVYATFQPTLTRVDAAGKPVWVLEAKGLQAFGKTGAAFRVTHDARRVWFGLNSAGFDPVEFDLTTERLFRNDKPGEDLLPPVENLLPVADWRESFEPKLGGKILKHQKNEPFRSMAQQPDGSGFFLGSEFQLWHYDRTGSETRLWKPPGPVHGVNVSRDGRLLVAAYGDGTIRWQRVSDSAELLALYVDTKTLAWIAWTPSGYFLSSPGGDELGGWHLNRGFGKAADFFPMSRFRSRFYRPDIVKLVLQTLDEKAAVAAADAVSQGRGGPAPSLIDRLPPVINILAPGNGALLSAHTVTLEYEVRSPGVAAADQVAVMLNGRPIDVRAKPPQPATANGTVRATLEIVLPDDVSGPVELGLLARAGGEQSSIAKVRVDVRPPSAPPLPNDLLKPRLFALVVGVSDYATPGLVPLKYAAKDADDFAALLKRQEFGLYGTVEVHPLTNGKATTAAIKEGLAWLDEHVTRHDVGIVYLAGHGLTDARNRFWFLSADADQARLPATALSREDINTTLLSLRGRVIVFLDACHAGQALAGDANVDMNALMGDLSASGQSMVMFSSSTGRELSYESPEWGNGAFTKSVIEAIAEGRADSFKTGRITSSLLDAYAVFRVDGLTKGHQHPMMFRSQQSADFDIAVVR